MVDGVRPQTYILRLSGTRFGCISLPSQSSLSGWRRILLLAVYPPRYVFRKNLVQHFIILVIQFSGILNKCPFFIQPTCLCFPSPIRVRLGIDLNLDLGQYINKFYENIKGFMVWTNVYNLVDRNLPARTGFIVNATANHIASIQHVMCFNQS